MSLTIQFVPYHELEGLSSPAKIKKLLRLARENKIILVEGRLKKEEETELIKTTMEEIDDSFKGIEIAVIYPDMHHSDAVKKIKEGIANILLGDRVGFTVIGPANIVKDVKKDPNKIQLFTKTPFAVRKRIKKAA